MEPIDIRELIAQGQEFDPADAEFEEFEEATGHKLGPVARTAIQVVSGALAGLAAKYGIDFDAEAVLGLASSVAILVAAVMNR